MKDVYFAYLNNMLENFIQNMFEILNVINQLGKFGDKY